MSGGDGETPMMRRGLRTAIGRWGKHGRSNAFNDAGVCVECDAVTVAEAAAAQQRQGQRPKAKGPLFTTAENDCNF